MEEPYKFESQKYYYSICSDLSFLSRVYSNNPPNNYYFQKKNRMKMVQKHTKK